MNNVDPSTVTAADLQNPQIDAETLRHIARVRPDLRQVILQHPNCHAELANFIHELPNDAPPEPPHMQPYPDPYQSSGSYQSPPYSYGYAAPRPLSPDDEKLWGVLMHIGNLILGFLVPLIIWLIYRDRSETLNQQGRAALNWAISYLIYLLISSVLIVVLIGGMIWPVVMILDVVFCIIAAVKAGSLQAWKYPLSIPFLEVRI
ncbi:MAG TPA: DUF4870 domain-containing protein [Enteractinococcus helveticum]|uniref:DUF4870 domain-containing protein n=1 Tax=Enteractinococcus helveticum TaxID=1837282 RepID=A0A921FMU8_9MICC|nr:DUF4870 domain-containing protein [Enteractinococcus helveticum]HJF15004.1 DUF4870 domain-containing protein [Enteractinococcus helveticum]